MSAVPPCSLYEEDRPSCSGPDYEGGSSLDAAMAVFCRVLPDYGFKLVFPPRLPDGARPDAFVSAWQRGALRAATYSAPTPALALLRAAKAEVDRRRDMEQLQSCSWCRGLGWYVAKGGAKELCRHNGKKTTAPGWTKPGAVKP